MDALTQKTLFLTREQKQALLDQAEFALPGSTPRTTRAVKRLLWAIETLPESSRTKAILAARMECSPRNCARVIRTAETLGVLHTVAAPGDASYYTIDWPAVARLRIEMSPVTSKCHPCHPNVTRDIPMSPVTFALRPVTSSATPEKQAESVNSDNRHAVRVAGAGAMNDMYGCMNESLGTLQNDSSIHPSHSIVSTTAPKRGGGLGPGGWPEKITADTLRRVDKIHELYLFALSRGWITTEDRVGFVATAGHIGRTVKESDNPGGKFTNRVKTRDWDVAPPSAHQAAVVCIERLDRDLQSRSVSQDSR